MLKEIQDCLGFAQSSCISLPTTGAFFSTKQIQSFNQWWLGISNFPALQTVNLDLRVLVGSKWFLPLLWLAAKITSVLVLLHSIECKRTFRLKVVKKNQNNPNSQSENRKYPKELNDKSKCKHLERGKARESAGKRGWPSGDWFKVCIWLAETSASFWTDYVA